MMVSLPRLMAVMWKGWAIEEGNSATHFHAENHQFAVLHIPPMAGPRVLNEVVDFAGGQLFGIDDGVDADGLEKSAVGGFGIF